MTRAELEARIWAITGRELTGERVDALLDLVDEYTKPARAGRRVLRHESSTDLWPAIGALADAMLGTGEDLPVLEEGVCRTADYPMITKRAA